MLPPTAEIERITMVEIPLSCWRVRHNVASTSPKEAAVAAVTRVITANPGRWWKRSSRNASFPHRNMTQIWSMPSSVM